MHRVPEESMIDDLFFQLIRVSVGTQDSLTRQPSAKEWKQLYEMAKKQSLVGVCFSAVQRLVGNSFETSQITQTSHNLSELQYLTWMGMAAKIQQKNEVVNRQCVELQRKLSADGIRSSILKGQSVGALYNLLNPSVGERSRTTNLSFLRQSGDIDVFVDCGMSAARAYAEKECGQPCRYDYKNLHWPVFDDTEVEMHYRVDVIMDVLKHGKMQRFWECHKEDLFGSEAELSSEKTVVCPTLQLNSFYILFHCYRHLFEGGVGLRQVMDYFFVLKAQNEQEDALASKAETMKQVKDFGMKRFTSAMMWIMQEVFGMSREMLLCEPDEKEGRYILKDMMEGGNFGHHDERIKDVGASSRTRYMLHNLQHGMHLLTHYPREVISSPIWTVWHWMWKRMKK